MLTTFYFDEELFDDEAIRNIPVVNDCMLDNWLKYGCLAMCDESKGKILSAIINVQTKYRQKWMTAFTSNAFKKCSINMDKPNISKYRDITEFREIFYPQSVITGVLASEYKEFFTTTNCSNGAGVVEIVTPCDFNESFNFTSSAAISILDISSDECFEDIWEKRFKGLAKHTKVITIIDRYLALNLEQDLNDGLNTSIAKLIEMLSRNTTHYTIDIFSACDIPGENVNATSLKNYINNDLKKKPFYSDRKFEIKISLCKNSFFKKESHDRMMSFDRHVVQIGKGMDIFRDKAIERNNFTIKNAKSTSFSEIYNTLTKNREWVYKPR